MAAELIRYDAACKAIAEARTTDEAKDWHDKAAAMQAYAKQAKNKELEVDAAEIRLRAERRLGEMIAVQKATVGLNAGGRPTETGANSEPVSVPTLAQIGIDKKLSSRAQKIAVVPADKFESMIANWRERVSAENERVSVNLLREGDRQILKDLPSYSLPAGVYSLIYADPPWRYEHVKTESRAIENHYPTMSLDEIKALSVDSIAAPDCALFLWATSPKLAEAQEVIEAWGFTYRTCAVWVKDKIGMGYYFRQRHELLLVATKGSPPAPLPSARVDSVISAPRQAHSAKPVEVYSLLEVMYPNSSRVELFSRTPRAGWEAWGNQAA